MLPHRRSLIACGFLLLLSTPLQAEERAGAGAAAKATAPKFLDVVKENFAAWDRDKNAELSGDEIELAVHNPAVKGHAAAAAAALRRAVRAEHARLPVTLAKLVAEIPYDAKSKAEPKPANYEGLYDSALAKIAATKREIFVSDKPSVDGLHQGRLGDCFLLAGLGTMAHCYPERLKQMIEPTTDGQIAVTFGSGQRVVLPPPTDAEIVIGAETGNDGVWANVFEKAIGQLYLERQTTKKHVTPFSIIGVGGTPNTPLSFLTGHRCKRLGCEDFQKEGLLQGEAREARLKDIRQQLTATLKAGRVIVGGTAPISGQQVKVPGLYYNHSYGVLNYDEQTDLVTFWNPFGNKFTPKGPASLKHGYQTSHGRFEVPLPEAVMWFGSFSIETTEPPLAPDEKAAKSVGPSVK